MEKNLLIILVGKRHKKVADIQHILTDYGCLIKTRLGIHDTIGESGCSENGLIILELIGDKNKHLALEKELLKLDEVKTKLVTLGF